MARVIREKRKEEPIKSSSESLFLELMMQMLAFFILLTSMAIIVEEKRLAALGSLAGSFSSFSQGANMTKGQGAAMPSRDISDIRKVPKRTAKALTNLAKEMGLGDAIHVLPLDQRQVRVRMNEDIFFAAGQTQISAEMQPMIDALARLFMQPEVLSLRIEGHTDRMPMRSSLSMHSQWDLSAARAMSVFLALAERGMAKSKMSIMGFGSSHPLRDAAGFVLPKKSRRVEFVLQFTPVSSDHVPMHASPVLTGVGAKERHSVVAE